MSYRISITGNDSHILIELFGDINLKKVLATNAYLYKDQDFIEHPYAIWDFTECTIDTEVEQVAEFAQEILQQRVFDTPGRTAFITHDPSAAQMAAPLIELVGELPIEIKGFPNRVAAVQWLKSE